MKVTGIVLVLGLAVAGAVGAASALAQDASILQKREAAMKQQGKDLAAVKAYVEGKGELAAAQAATADLVQIMATIPALFPKDTGMAQFPGKSGAKPVIWTEWDKFTGAHRNAVTKAEALNAAAKSG